LTALGIAAGLTTKVTADIPFDFNVGGKTLPAGKYTVAKGTTQGLLIIQDSEKGASAGVIAQTSTANMDGKATLQFRRYGNQYFLASVSDGNNTNEIPVTKAERKTRNGDNLAMELKPEIVTVSATAGQ
ncbi:MAG: hypothetical protein JNK38_20590, partial [Acidobacteria bacterium]|nr:hypothetical protein [Acidobacteriota bacterium]